MRHTPNRSAESGFAVSRAFSRPKMYDLHAHILPGVDDGARDMGEALAMSREAARTGTKIILATPHRRDITENWSVAHIAKLVDDLNARAAALGLGISHALGMENHLDEDLPAEIDAGRALTMNGTRYILIEPPFFGAPDWIEPTLEQVQKRGLIPVLAHPERIEAFQRDPEFLARLVGRGMLSQITSGSVVGTWGDDVADFARELLARRLAHVMASDTHAPDGLRSPNMSVGIREASRIVGESAALAMVRDVPLAILRDRPVEIPPPLPG